MRSVMCQQAFAIGREAEEIIFFLDPDERRVRVVGAVSAPFLDFLVGLERLAAGAIVTFVHAFIDIARVMDGLDELLAADVMPLLAGLDEIVVGDIERAPDILKLPGHQSTYCLGSRPSSRARWGTLIVFSSLPIKKWTESPFHAAESSLDVGADLLERRADVRPAIGIVDRRRDVKTRCCPSSLPRCRCAYAPIAGRCLRIDGQISRRP